MMAILRHVGATLAGLVVAFVLVMAVEAASAVVHPFPEDFDGTHEEICAHVERYPAWVLALVVPVWALAGFAGTWVAGRLGSRGGSVVVGLLIVAALASNLWMLPYPTWFKAACAVFIPAAAAAGVYLAFGRTMR